MVSLIAVLVYVTLPLLLVAWAFRHVGPPDPNVTPASLKARITLTAIILAVTAASLTYRAIVFHGLQQTAALFLGAPVVLASVVSLATSTPTATGVGGQ